MAEQKISYGSIATVVAVAQGEGKSGERARDYIEEVKDELTDSARALVEQELEADGE